MLPTCFGLRCWPSSGNSLSFLRCATYASPYVVQIRFTQLTLSGFLLSLGADCLSVRTFRFSHVKFRLRSIVSITTENDRLIGYRSINKTYKNTSRHIFINNLSAATCFGFVSHLQAEYTIVTRTVYYNAVSGFDQISSFITIEYYK